MTSKEALKTIGELYLFEESVQIPYDPPLKEQYKKEYEILLKLVKRDTPKKPIVNIDNEIKEYNCGVCVCRLDIRQNFCPKCGNRIGWNIEE